MGRSMAGHLLKAGYPLAVFNRTREKADALVAQGAVWCATPAAVAQLADIVFTMVGFPSDVESVYFGPDGLLSAPTRASILVDMTSAPPALAIRIAEAARTTGRQALDAPVSGGDIGAREARLAIMVGGEASALERVRPLLGKMGAHIVHMGGPGAGQHTKLSNQITVAGTIIGVCEALAYAVRQGLDPAAVIEIVEKGAAQSWTLSQLGRRMARDDFAPGFYVEHFVKDLGIALDECARAGLSLPGLSLAHRLYSRIAGLGHARSGTQALYRAIREGIADA